MKYKHLVDEILDHVDDTDQLHEVMGLVIGKAINQERIQIYKTLAIYFSELTDKNKAYLVEKIKANQVILDERVKTLTDNGVFTNTNDFFDLEEGMEKIRIDKNLIKNYGTITFDETGNLAGERPPTRDGTVYVTNNTHDNLVTNTIAATRAFYTEQRTVPVPQPVNPHNTGIAVDVAMDRGADLERRVTMVLDTIQENPDVDWLQLLENEEATRTGHTAIINEAVDEFIDDFENEDEQE